MSPLAARAAAAWSRHVWRADSTWLAHALAPLSWVYRRLAIMAAEKAQRATLPVPVVVVGNWVVGGAGKTPAVIALVQALAARGFTPGVVSRGYGSRADASGDIVAVLADSAAANVGDEPLLIQRRTGVPVWVGRDRPAAVQALLARHAAVDVIVSDDGLQHHALPRTVEIWVFDDRGIGNGRLLPAGPLRAPLPATVPSHARVLYAGAAVSTALPGVLAVRALRHAVPLASWWRGDLAGREALPALAGRQLVAVAGIAAPEKFFVMLEAAGLSIQRAPQPDHADYSTLPWPTGMHEVVLTEKDAVKLLPAQVGTTRVWVVPLDFVLPETWVDQIAALVRPAASTTTPP